QWPHAEVRRGRPRAHRRSRDAPRSAGRRPRNLAEGNDRKPHCRNRYRRLPERVLETLRLRAGRRELRGGNRATYTDALTSTGNPKRQRSKRQKISAGQISKLGFGHFL